MSVHLNNPNDFVVTYRRNSQNGSCLNVCFNVKVISNLSVNIDISTDSGLYLGEWGGGGVIELLYVYF